jgi:hypothetical protein
MYYCEGPDCATHARTTKDGAPYDFLTVKQGRGGKEHHFHTWDCLLRYAAQFPPPEIVSGGEQE